MSWFKMSWFKEPGNARQLSAIERAYSQELDSTTDQSSSEILTERMDFARIDCSFSASSSANGGPDIPSRISSLNLNPSTTSISQDTRSARKDIEKSDSTSFDGSGPKVAELVDHDGKQDPFAQECEGGVQYRTMAWW